MYVYVDNGYDRQISRFIFVMLVITTLKYTKCQPNGKLPLTPNHRIHKQISRQSKIAILVLVLAWERQKDVWDYKSKE